MPFVDGYVRKNSDYPAVPPRTGYTGSWNKYTGAIHESITITARYTKNGSVAMSVGDEAALLTADIMIP